LNYLPYNTTDIGIAVVLHLKKGTVSFGIYQSFEFLLTKIHWLVQLGFRESWWGDDQFLDLMEGVGHMIEWIELFTFIIMLCAIITLVIYCKKK